MTGKNVTVVTGAAGALGGVVVEHLVGAGHTVIAVVREAEADRLRGVVEPTGGLVVMGDLHSPATWQRVLDGSQRGPGAPTGAVLVAGAWRGGRDEATWEAMLGANLHTARRAFDALLPGMIARREGSLVVMGSRAVERPWESAGAAAYAASKAAVVAMARAIAEEVKDSGVRVNAILPATIATKANAAAMTDADANWWVKPRGLAELIGYLLSPAAAEVTGAAIPVYGRA